MLVDDVDAEAGVEGGRMGTLSYATLGGEGGYHLRLAGGCVLSKVYLLELTIVTLKPCRLSENLDMSSID